MNDINKDLNFALNNEDFYKAADKFLIFDVRTKPEYKMLKRIKNARNVHYLELIANSDLYIPNKDTLFITYCNAGNRSTDAAQQLLKQGYHNAHVLDDGVYGLERWLKANQIMDNLLE